jgi:hypothetical protein
MSVAWVGVGVAAAGVIGSAYSSSKATSAAKKAGKRADSADARRMDFEEQRYDEWQETYGPVEDQLAAYYNTLTPTLRITQGLENFEKEKKIAIDNLDQKMAQRNIDRSGMTAQLDSDVAIDSAEARARIRANAPMEVAKEKASFLSVGLGQNPNDAMTNAFSAEQARSAGLEQQTAKNAGIAQGAVIDSATNLVQVGLETWAANREPANPDAGEGVG